MGHRTAVFVCAHDDAQTKCALYMPFVDNYLSANFSCVTAKVLQLESLTVPARNVDPFYWSGGECLIMIINTFLKCRIPQLVTYMRLKAQYMFSSNQANETKQKQWH